MAVPRAVICVTLVVLSLLAVTEGSDPVIPDCILTMNTYNTYSSLKSCLTSTAVNATAKDIVIDSLQKMVPSYAFNAPSQDSPDPVHFPMRVNLEAELARVGKTKYKHDADFQQALADVFVPLHDAHTRYNKPAPYKGTAFVLPFRLTGQGIGKAFKILLKEDTTTQEAYNSVYNKDPFNGDDVDGMVLTKINGQSAKDVTVAYANNSISYCKDLDSRVNLALNGYGDGRGYFAYRPLAAFGIPPTGNVSITLSSTANRTLTTKTYSMNFIGYYYGNFSAAPAKSEATVKAATVRHGLDELREEARLIWPNAIKDANEPAPGTKRVYSYDENIWYDDLGDGTGVLRVLTFGPPEYRPFIEVVEKGLAYFHANNGTKLILDLRDNGGGDICLGYALIRFLFPDLTGPGKPPIVGRYDVVASDLFVHMAHAGERQMCNDPTAITTCGEDPTISGYFTPCSWYTWSDEQQAYNNSWVLESRNFTRGGVSKQYSQEIYEGCGYQYNNWTTPGCYPQLAPNNFVILSNGLCGSTCAVTSSFIQMNGLAKAMVIGGYSDKNETGDNMQFWSFPGGEVVQIDYVRQMAEQYGVLSSPLVPEAVPSGGSFRFAIREIYPWGTTNDSLPLEFVYVPADVHVGYNSDWSDTAAIYQLAATTLSTCLPPLYGNPCSVDNGSGREGCTSDGKTSGCVAVDCDAGYFVKDGVCSSCPAGTYREAGDSETTKCRDCVNGAALDGLSDVTYTKDGVTTSDCPFRPGGWVGWFMQDWRLGVGLGAAALIGIVIGGVGACICRPKRKDGHINSDYGQLHS